MLSRLKFEISPLVKEMLDQLPTEVWQSATTTFLDPAMGGGQFLVEIERRLRAAGHSEENIASRVYGCEKNKLRVNYAKNNKKLASTNLYISDFLSYNWGTMKFDVIVGNPPYQLTNSKKLWPDFINQSLDLIKDKGVIALVVPTSWLDSNASAYKNIRDKMTTDFDLVYVNRLAKNYFDVGQDICAFVSFSRPYQSKVRYVDATGQTTIDLTVGLPKSSSEIIIEAIIQKIISVEPKIQWVINDKTDRIRSEDLQSEPSDLFCYPVWQSTANRGYVKQLPKDFGQLKLAVNYSSAYYSAKTADGNMPITTDGIGSLMGYILIPNKKYGENLRSYLQSKSIRFLVANYKKKNTGFSDAVKRGVIPMLDNRQWCDIDLYNFFQFTNDEIALIEDMVV